MLAHVLIALVIKLVVSKGLRTDWWAGAAAAAAWAIAREVTQAEYRWIEQYGGGLRANMPRWGGFDPRVWHVDAVIDWLVPTLVVFGLAAFLEHRKRKAGSGSH